MLAYPAKHLKCLALCNAMTITRHFFKKHNFAYSRCTGNIDDHDLHVHVLSFQVESKGLAFVREVLDFRRLKKADRLTVQGMIEISDLERERSEDRDFRLAILTRHSLFRQIGRIYALVIETANLRVKVFDDQIDQALTWLGYDAPRAMQISRFIDAQNNTMG